MMNYYTYNNGIHVCSHFAADDAIRWAVAHAIAIARLGGRASYRICYNGNRSEHVADVESIKGSFDVKVTDARTNETRIERRNDNAL